MQLLTELKRLLNDHDIVITEEVQSLWSGYGQIVRCFSPKNKTSYIVKTIVPDNATNHPRGWNTSVSHQRKLKSYQIESNFYQNYAQLTDKHCKVPTLIDTAATDTYTLLVMEDLDFSGYEHRIENANWNTLSIAIRWLAYFHAKFMGSNANTLWPIGTYWHLATRQDELEAMPDGVFKANAKAIDDALNNAKFQTLVHGDAKFANLCFHTNNTEVAAVDFQYIGRGSGVKDLAYLAGSCLGQQGLGEFGEAILKTYLENIEEALVNYKVDVKFDELADETKKLYPIAWADFYRFLLGWNPQSWKICDYMKLQANIGLSSIQNN
jgi:hypothetical protein